MCCSASSALCVIWVSELSGATRYNSPGWLESSCDSSMEPSGRKGVDEAAGTFNPGGTPRSDCSIVFKLMKRVEMRPSAGTRVCGPATLTDFRAGRHRVQGDGSDCACGDDQAAARAKSTRFAAAQEVCDPILARLRHSVLQPGDWRELHYWIQHQHSSAERALRFGCALGLCDFHGREFSDHHGGRDACGSQGAQVSACGGYQWNHCFAYLRGHPVSENGKSER